MAKPGPQTLKKRQRELAKQNKRKQKAERRAQRKEQKALDSAEEVEPGVDPDIAGIVPGPQTPLFLTHQNESGPPPNSDNAGREAS